MSDYPTIELSDFLKARLRASETRATTATQLASALPQPNLQTQASRSPQTTILQYSQEIVRDGAVGYWPMGPTLVDGEDQVPITGVYPLIIDPPVSAGSGYLAAIIADGATHAWSLDDNTATNAFADAIGGLGLVSSPRAADDMASTAIGPATVASPLLNGVFAADGTDNTKDSLWSAATDLGAAVGDMAVEVWFQCPAVTGSLLGLMVGVVDPLLSNYVIITMSGSFLGTGKVTAGMGSTTITSPLSYDDNQPHLATFSRSGSVLTLMVDGVSVVTGSLSTAQDLSNAKVQLGAIDYGAALPGYKVYSFAGSLSWAAYYPNAITPTQALAHYTAGTA